MQKYNLPAVIRRKKFKYVSEQLHKFPNLLPKDQIKTDSAWKTKSVCRLKFNFHHGFPVFCIVCTIRGSSLLTQSVFMCSQKRLN